MEVQKYPEVRFEQFNDNWHGLKLADFGESFSGTAIESEFVKKGKYKVISIGSYSLDSTYTDQALRVNYTEKTKDRILGLNDLAMVLNDKTLSGEIIGRTLLIEEDDAYVFNQRTQRIILNQKLLDPFFIYQLLNANFIRSKVIKLAQGNTQIYVNWSTIKNIEHLIPSKEEQKHISQFFRKLDQSIALHEKKFTKTQNFKKAMLEKMFPKQGSNRPEIRLKGFSGDWDEFKLGDIYNFNYGKFNTNPSNGGQYPVYGANGIIGGYTEYNAENSAVIGHMGEYAGSVLWAEGKHFVTYNGTIAKPKQADFDSLFGYFTLVKMNLKKICGGSGQPFLSYDVLERLNILLPCLEEQTLIGQFFKRLDDAINLQKQQLQTVKNLKQALLEKMFV